jgi:hypothetical protein
VSSEVNESEWEGLRAGIEVFGESQVWLEGVLNVYMLPKMRQWDQNNTKIPSLLSPPLTAPQYKNVTAPQRDSSNFTLGL